MSSILTLLGSGHQTCMKHTNAKWTVDSLWWWAEKMSETYRALRQNKIWIISASSWLFNYEGTVCVNEKLDFSVQRNGNLYTRVLYHIYSKEL
jgi:hypothetical protein